MNDDQAGRIADAVLILALTVRDEGPEFVTDATRRVLDAAGGNLTAALTIAAALIDVERPVHRWWQEGIDGVGVTPADDVPALPVLRAAQEKTCTGCNERKTGDGFVLDRSRADGLSSRCRVCRAADHASRKSTAA